MPQTLVAEDFRIAPESLRETPQFEDFADVGGYRARQYRVDEVGSEPTVMPATRTGAAAPARSRLSLLGANVFNWLKGCAEAYAAAAAYEDLSRLSDTELRHRSLSRDVLARDLGSGG